MLRIALRLSLVALAGLAAACATVGDDPPPGASAATLLEAGKARLEAGLPNRAADLFELVIEDHGESPEAEEAAWLLGEVYFADERWRKASRAFQDYHEANPLGRLGELENRMYDLGVKMFLSGQSGLFGLGIFPSFGEAPETFEWLLVNLPTGARADDALMFMARIHLDEERWAEGILHLDRLLAGYPQSEWALTARFLKASAHRSLSRGPDYDEKTLLEAKKSFEAYVKLVSRDPARQVEYADRLAEAKEAITGIESRLAQKKLLIGRWYTSQERWPSARIYLDDAVKTAPGSEGAAQARGLLDELEDAGR
ncbi:MAG: outer membrane protein assembly factor BamD [Planctomycetes bacterium]|jgi:outer membrane protein assembly factor BamD (BamD/ComL family)|nr:outer membrane protein assembly factor BamD [Planctomycetota bacterium]